MVVTPPSVPFAVWVWAAFDPILVGVAAYLGWRADQAGKIFVAAIAALGLALLADWALTWMGVPLPAPLSRTGPTLIPVRSVAALFWTVIGYSARRLWDRRA